MHTTVIKCTPDGEPILATTGEAFSSLVESSFAVPVWTRYRHMYGVWHRDDPLHSNPPTYSSPKDSISSGEHEIEF